MCVSDTHSIFLVSVCEHPKSVLVTTKFTVGTATGQDISLFLGLNVKSQGNGSIRIMTSETNDSSLF